MISVQFLIMEKDYSGRVQRVKVDDETGYGWEEVHFIVEVCDVDDVIRSWIFTDFSQDILM